MSKFDDVLDAHRTLLEAFPGDHFEGNITGHCEEWRTEFTLDYCPSDESEEQENEYSLVFSLVETPEGSVAPSLTLDYVVAEVGVNDRHTFDLTDRESVASQLSDVCDEWDMHKNSEAIARPLLDKVFELRERSPEMFSKAS